MRKSEADAAERRRKAGRQAQKDGYQLSQNTLAAADWFILVTSLKATEFSTDDVLAVYRLRWRVELGFKRLKSVIGLHGPPGTDERSARPYPATSVLLRYQYHIPNGMRTFIVEVQPAEVGLRCCRAVQSISLVWGPFNTPRLQSVHPPVF